MAVPTSITELSTTANSNPPSGSESTAEGDQQIRAAYSFIAQNYAEKAPKASPTFTGTPAAPTAAVDTNTTQLATTAFVIGQAYAKLASPTLTGTPAAPTAAADTNTTQIATTAYVVGQAYAKLASPSFTGTVTIGSGANGATAMNAAGLSMGRGQVWTANASELSTANRMNLGTSGTWALGLFTSNSERFTIESNGFINVNGTGGTQWVNVYGNSASTAIPASFNDARSADGVSSDCVVIRRAGSQVGAITTTNAATAYATSSDYRLKNISGDVESSGAFIDALQPRVGTWKVDGSPFVGFVAHELQAVSPTSVTGEKDGEQMQSVAYGSAELIANMVAELKSLRARVAALES